MAENRLRFRICKKH